MVKIKPDENLFQTAPWMRVAYNEYSKHISRYGSVSKTGSHIHGAGKPHDNPEILLYLQAAGISKKSKMYTEDTSWCSAFVNYCFQQVGIPGTHQALARSWLHWHHGFPVDPTPGAVVVFARGKDPTFGHVAFVWEVISSDYMIVLGGNQGERHATKSHAGGVASHISAVHYHAVPLGCMWPTKSIHTDISGQSAANIV